MSFSVSSPNLVLTFGVDEYNRDVELNLFLSGILNLVFGVPRNNLC